MISALTKSICSPQKARFLRNPVAVTVTEIFYLDIISSCFYFYLVLQLCFVLFKLLVLVKLVKSNIFKLIYIFFISENSKRVQRILHIKFIYGSALFFSYVPIYCYANFIFLNYTFIALHKHISSVYFFFFYFSTSSSSTSPVPSSPSTCTHRHRKAINNHLKAINNHLKLRLAPSTELRPS